MTKIYNIISFQHYAFIMTKKIFFFFISVLRSIRRNHGKKTFPIATTPTTFVIMTKIVFLCCYYVYYTVIKTKNMYFYFRTTFTTAWLRKKIFYISALRSLRLDRD